MEIKLNVNKNMLKEFGLEGIFKDMQKQLQVMPFGNQKMFFNTSKHPGVRLPNRKLVFNLEKQGLNQNEVLDELNFQKVLNRKPRQRYSEEEIIEMQERALLNLRMDVIKIINKMNVVELSNFVRRHQ